MPLRHIQDPEPRRFKNSHTCSASARIKFQLRYLTPLQANPPFGTIISPCPVKRPLTTVARPLRTAHWRHRSASYSHNSNARAATLTSSPPPLLNVPTWRTGLHLALQSTGPETLRDDVIRASLATKKFRLVITSLRPPSSLAGLDKGEPMTSFLVAREERVGDHQTALGSIGESCSSLRGRVSCS